MELDIYRLLFVFFSGYFLCVSGSLSQLVTNNNLGSPSTLGMDGLAVLVIIVSQFLVVKVFSGLEVEVLSFSLFVLVFILFVLHSLRKKEIKDIWKVANIKGIILLGLSFNLFVGAVFSIVQFMFMALNYEFPTGLWFGNFKQYDSWWLYLFIIVFAITLIILNQLKTKLSSLNLGQGFALGMNIDVAKVQKQSLSLALFLTGLVVCFFGVFSFLGLIFPHILRSFKIFKTNMNLELLLGPFIAGALLTLIDLGCYHFTYQGAELPVGMASSVIGSFFLIFLIIKSRV